MAIVIVFARFGVSKIPQPFSCFLPEVMFWLYL